MAGQLAPLELQQRANGVFRNRLLDINAFFWLVARARLKPAHVWITLVATPASGLGAGWKTAPNG